MRDQTLERKIHFFYIEAVSEDSSLSSFELLKDSFEYIDNLPFNDGDEGRYLDVDSSKSLSTIVLNNASDIRGKIGNRRVSGLPLKENQGEEQPLELDDEESLFEPSHFIIFPPGILAMEYNFYGPRYASVRNYIVDKVPDITHVNIQQLFKDDATGIISRLAEIYKVEITADAEGLERFGQLDNSLRDAFLATERASNGSERISIELWSSARSDIGIDLGWRDKIADFLREPNNRDVVQKFKVQGIEMGNSSTEYFDLLEDQFVKKKSVFKQDPRHRIVETASAINAIREAFTELEDSIRNIIN